MTTGLYCQFFWRNLILAECTWRRFTAPRKIAAEATIMYQSVSLSPRVEKGLCGTKN